MEESVNGQKVIKVFNHEPATAATFDAKNEELFHASAQANIYGNITMPVVNNMGYLLYILLAVVGGAMALAGVGNFGLSGTGEPDRRRADLAVNPRPVVHHPIARSSQQFNMVMMALAGASRIFALMDEPPESGQGHRAPGQRGTGLRRPHDDRDAAPDPPLGVEARGQR